MIIKRHLIDVQDADLGSKLESEFPCQGSSDALGAAGDDHHLAIDALLAGEEISGKVDEEQCENIEKDEFDSEQQPPKKRFPGHSQLFFGVDALRPRRGEFAR